MACGGMLACCFFCTCISYTVIASCSDRPSCPFHTHGIHVAVVNASRFWPSLPAGLAPGDAEAIMVAWDFVTSYQPLLPGLQAVPSPQQLEAALKQPGGAAVCEMY